MISDLLDQLDPPTFSDEIIAEGISFREFYS